MFRTVVVLRKGGTVVRGSEACVIENIAGLLERKVRVILAANNPDVILRHLPAAPVEVIPLTYPELMFDGPCASRSGATSAS